tara:strand:- start:136 stop:699 length:564 start_codon:yes stop_codon:yes gene_type:complete
MLVDKLNNLMYCALGSRRSVRSATDLQSFLENDCKLEPTYWIGLGFKYPVSEDKARDRIASFINKMNHEYLRTHIWPIVVWNTNSEGLVAHDVHIILCLDRGRRSLGVYGILAKELSRFWRYGRVGCFQLYRRGGNAIHYSTLKHREQAFMVFCPNRGSCNCQRKKKNDCKWRKNPLRMLKGFVNEA